MSAPGLTPPTVGNRYVKRNAPDAGRVVTITRVWVADDGHTAVAYEWGDDKPGQCFSACPLDVFHRGYRAEEARVTPIDGEAELFEELWSMEYRITGDKPKAKAYARDFLDRHLIVMAAKVRGFGSTTAGRAADWWDAATIPDAIADDLDPRCAGCGESRNNGHAHGPNQGYGGCV